MERQTRILVVDDDAIVRSLLTGRLEAVGHAVTAVGSGAEMSEALTSDEFDLVMLDLGLPDEDGIVLLRQIRTRQATPVVVLTSRDDSLARRTALELGADDYIGKDVDPEEILLRVRNILSRAGHRTVGGEIGGGPQVFEFSGWQLDPAERTLTDPGGVEVGLTAAEFDILHLLVRASGRVLSRDQLLDGLMRADDVPTDRMVDAYVSRIRRKMGDRRFITTVTGVGYRFVPEPR